MSLVTSTTGFRVAGVQIDQLVDDFVVVQMLGQNQIRFGLFAHQNRQQALRPALAALDRHTQFDIFGDASPRVLSISRMA